MSKPVEEMTREELEAEPRTIDELIRWGDAQPDDDATRALRRMYELDQQHPFEITLDDFDAE